MRTYVENLSKHFMKLLPKILNTFKSSPEIVSELSEIPQYFDLELYSAERAKNVSFKLFLF